MKIETFFQLKELQKKYGIKGTASGPFGKIAQKLLALSFHKIGFYNIVERSVQGADIDITKNKDEKYTCEVKVSDRLVFNLANDNIAALSDRSNDGYIPLIAVLKLSVCSDWVIMKIPINEIPSGDVLIDSLRKFRLKDIEKAVSIAFDKVFEEHFEETLKKGDIYLRERLKQLGIENA